MGELISKKAKAEDILSDAHTTVSRGRAKGGEVQAIVERRLIPFVEATDAHALERDAAQRLLVERKAARDAAVDAGRLAVSATYDTLWNDVGRPATAAALAIVFPGGASGYLDGPVDELGGRIGILHDVLGRGLHPRMTPGVVTACRERLAVARDACTSSSAAHREASLRAAHAERVFYALARSTHAALSAVKRDLRSEGMSEASVHEIIPDRPRDRPETEAAPTRQNGAPQPPTT